MELTPSKYYNQSKFPNVYYLTLMAIENYFGTELFKGDLSRVFYASPEFSLRRRLDMLNRNADQSVHSLDVPFLSYYRAKNWEVDRARPAVENATAAMFGLGLEGIDVPARFMNTKASFSAIATFGRDDEAQLAHEILLWIKHPSVKQFTFPGLAYKQYNIDIPIQLQIDEIEFNPDFKEKDWLKQNRMVTIKFGFSVRSVMISPIAQGTKDYLFPTEDEGGFYITKQAYLDYYSSKNLPLPAEAYIDLSVIGSFTNDPSLEGTLTAGTITENSVVLNWDYAALASDLFEDNVKITNDKGFSTEIAKATKTLTIEDLKPESTYTFTIWFFSKTSAINNYSVVVETPSSSTKPLGLKVIKGL